MKTKKKLAYVMLYIFLFNILIQSAVYGILPDFAVVNSNAQNVETEDASYKTEESSIHTSKDIVFNFQSEAQVLMEATTGEIIYANNENSRLLPASVTKIMTLLLLMEKIDSGAIRYDDLVTCSTQASKMGGSQIWFKEGETLTIDEALKCICVVSANDVSYAVAELVGGSHENFVQLMNNKAKELGMENTNFMNAHGIDEEGHYTSAKDIAIMSKELITKHPDIQKYTTIWMDNIRGGTFGLSNTNKLLKTYNGITGLKTGSTSAAGFNLSATAARDGLSLIAVVLKAPTSAIRNEEVTNLLNYGFSSYTSKKLNEKREVIDKISINKNVEEKVNVLCENEAYYITKRGESNECTKSVTYNNEITAPVKAGDVVGKIEYLNSENKKVAETNIIIEKDLEKNHIVELYKIYY